MVVDLLKNLVRIPSVSGSEGEIAAFAAPELSRLGFETHRKGDNVWGTIGSGGPRILLVSHLDTVPVAAGWTKDPYGLEESDGRIYGVGSNDAKASVAAMVTAGVQAREILMPGKGTVIVALACNEEAGRNGLETFMDDLLPLDGAIVGEPNHLEICIAQKGTLVFEVHWSGKTAHAAHGTSDHALIKAMEDLLALGRLPWTKVDRFLGSTRVEITQFHGGERVNVIPDRCSATLDIRYTPSYQPEEILAAVRGVVRGEITVYSDRRRAASTSIESAIARAARSAQPEAPITGSSTSSDWVFLKGVPAIKMGPGHTEHSHTVDEYIEIAQLERGVEVYRETLIRFFEEVGP